MLRSSSQRRGCSLVLKALLACSAFFFLGTAITVLSTSWFPHQLPTTTRVTTQGVESPETTPVTTFRARPSLNRQKPIQQQQKQQQQKFPRPPPRIIEVDDDTTDVNNDNALNNLVRTDDQPSTDAFSSADATPLPPLDTHHGGDGSEPDEFPHAPPPPVAKPIKPHRFANDIGEGGEPGTVHDAHTEWFDELLLSLANERLLTKNIKSKEHMWRALPPPPRSSKRAHALVYLGWVAFWNMEEAALTGGPAGEFVIWGDLVAGMAAIGYRLTFVHTVHGYWQMVKQWPTETFDVVITDYDGLGTAENAEQFPQHHCKYYVVDGFGTQPAFNDKRHMDLKRILTPYPFDEHNTAINVLAEQLPLTDWLPRESTGVLWAKTAKYLAGKEGVLKWITDVMPLHTSIAGGGSEPGALGELLKDSKRFIHHGFTDRKSFLQRMSSSRFLLGVGEPIDGPTAMEAMAQGCVFINARNTPPIVYDGKPTVRPYTSQHPFVEHYVPEPYAYTIDLKNKSAVDATMRAIQSWTPTPYRHKFNTEQYYVDNLRRIFSGQQLCNSGTSVPTRHPGNQVYESFEVWKQRCANTGCNPHQTQIQAGIKPSGL